MRIILFITLAILAASCLSLPGGKIEHKGAPTPVMQRALNALVKELDNDVGYKHTITKVDRIMTQVVAGRLYYLDVRVKTEVQSDIAVSAVIFHSVDDNMEVTKIEKGKRFDSLNDDQRRGLFLVMSHLGQQCQASLELVMIKSISSQVVSGVIYKYHITVKGSSSSLREEQVSVHHHWNGEFSVVKN
jgi:hypothetical protein